ncbi:AAA family ATPase [Bifidobacterium saguinibicoloris]|uniref:AAA family ATPase n=1 Tax=Bifidobacterium saguinibicoloris TaxID=2834433 RepID=UPI001C59FBB5|nr:AAA family ATPase [Bifidobacterium saguinibicoloris]MBW3080726.1 AAA family ATPase [Bifidobacterium saguinibicoloris]
MKLIAMKFQGFGPYKGEYAIDFTALTRSGMFLIDGETGAGKTTILDCLTFALYGNISGNEKDTLDAGGDGQRVRSRFLAGSRAETYVDLIFQSGDDYYEVRRTPKYDQPKARGEGVTPRNATGKLMRIDRGIAALIDEPANDPERYFTYAEGAGHAEAIIARAGDVRPEITRIIGLNREQFSRTIMLAQGQFAMFLSLTPEKRTELVENLFGATVYEDIQNELAERRKAMKTRMDQDGIRVVGGIADARTTAARILEERGLHADGNDLEILSNARWGLDREDARKLAYPAREPDEIREALCGVVTGVDVECDTLIHDGEAANTQAGRTLARARTRHMDAAALRGGAERERRDTQALLNIKANEESIGQDRRNLSRAVEAQPIIDLDHEYASAQARARNLAEQSEELQRQLERMTSRDELERRLEHALKEASGDAAARAAMERADAHEQLIDAAEQAQARHAQAKQTLAEARATAEQARQTMEALPDSESVEQELQRLAEQLGGEQGLTAQLDHAKRVLDHVQQAERLTAGMSALETSRDEAEAAHQAAQRTLDNAEAAIRQSGAAQYAASLEDGEPCPVCGSIDHPHPATVPDNVADAKELDELKQRVTVKQAKAEQARTALRDAERDLESQRERGEGLDIGQARSRITELETAIKALDEARERREELRGIQQRIATATEAARQTQAALAVAETKAEEAGRNAKEATAQAEGHTTATVAAERAAAQAQLDAATQAKQEAQRLKQAIDERAETERRHTQAQAQADAAARTTAESKAKLDQVLDESEHFTAIDEAVAAGLDERERATLQQRIRRHEDALHAAEANLARSRDELRDTIAGADKENLFAFGLAGYADDMAGARSMAQATAMPSRSAEGPEAVKEPETAPTAVPRGMPVAYTDAGEPTSLGKAIAAIDMTALEASVQEAQRHADETGRRVGTLSELAQRWRRQAETMEHLAGQWAEQTARFAPIERMAALANGDKSASGAANRLTLITYAVTERFRDVLDRANELLSDIQGGVYELRLKDTPSTTGIKKTGLDITVFDRRNEQERNPGTLSGGETFFVSLALALALADIIQAENGGISMDTLFVDEGFGTLSQDYLTDVMDMLRHISRTRDVGIISHVDWLKDQIAERISVSRITPDGESRLEVIA